MTACAWRRLLGAASAALALTVLVPAAQATDADAVALAKAAYDRGARAFDAGKYALAARELTMADELAPNPVALKFALTATLKLDDPVLGMRLVERAAAEGAELPALLREARDKFAGRVGRITLVCGDDPCRARIDGEPAKTVTWVTPGPHALEWEPSGRAPLTVTVAAGQSVDVTPPPGPAAPRPVANANPPAPVSVPDANGAENSDAGGGLAPAWFWVGIGVTTIAAGATAISGFDTLHQHDLFLAHPSTSTQHDGQAAETRTNVLLGVSAALALATGAVGLFAVRWAAPRKSNPNVAIHARGLGLAVTLTQ